MNSPASDHPPLPPTVHVAPPRPASPWAVLLAQAVRMRWVPFVLAGLISVAMSFDAPQGRKPFAFDLDVSWANLEFSLFKEPHIGAAAFVGMLAIVAVRRGRWWLALLLTVLVGLGWEVGQTTVIGHSARLADLLPDAIGAALGVAWGAVMLWLAERVARE